MRTKNTVKLLLVTGVLACRCLVANTITYEQFDASGRCDLKKIISYAKVAACSYRDDWNKVPEGYELVSKWGVEGYLEGVKHYRVSEEGEITSEPHNTRREATRLQARLLHGPRGEVVISFRGTDSTLLDWGDVVDDGQICIGRLPVQCLDAARLLWLVLKHSDHAEIIIVGHSLGGAIAQCAVAANDCHATKVSCCVFNSMGIPPRTIESFDRDRLAYANAHTLNFQMSGDNAIGFAKRLNAFFKGDRMRVLGTTVSIKGQDSGGLLENHKIGTLAQVLETLQSN